MEFHRQTGIVRPDELPPLTIIGCGGIGSPTAIICAKMGVPDLTLIDDDTVEAHNLPNQFYFLDDMGEKKSEALSKIIKGLSVSEASGTFGRIGPQSYLSGVVISGVDSMAARSGIWEAVKRQKDTIPLYIEGRMLRELFIVNTMEPVKMTPEDITWYESQLCSDEDAVDGPCTERAISYNTFCIGSIIALQVKKFAKQEEIKRQIIVDLTNLLMMT